jgi:hypothetical protein
MATLKLLNRVQEMVTDVNEVNSTNEKIEKLGKYDDLQDFLKLLMDPQKTTGVTATQLLKYEPKIKYK